MIITTAQKLGQYVEMFHRQAPIESQFQARILDNLNAEISRGPSVRSTDVKITKNDQFLGAISNIKEAVEWIRFSYFYLRLRKNPLQVDSKIVFKNV